MRQSCPFCGQSFVHTGPDDRSCCGRPYCRARAGWTGEQWSARADMAAARRAAGLPLGAWDLEALSRTRRR